MTTDNLDTNLSGVNPGTVLYEHNLVFGEIVARPSRFIFIVEIDGKRYRAHSPATSNIGGLALRGLPCLLSGPYDNRKTSWTVEALSPWPFEHELFQWVSINQSRMNRYIESAIDKGLFDNHIGKTSTLRREVKLGRSRIDFVLDDTFVEVKSPIAHLEMPVPDTADTTMSGGFSSRMIRQLEDMESDILDRREATGNDAISGVLLAAFGYSANNFEPEQKDWLHKKLSGFKNNGIDFMQYTMTIDDKGVYAGRLREIQAYG